MLGPHMVEIRGKDEANNILRQATQALWHVECPPGFYGDLWTDECVACSAACSPGTQTTVKCEEWQDRVCAPCGEGTFSLDGVA